MLIKCPECGKEISDKSDKCIHCGYPIFSEVLYEIKLISCGENKVKVIKNIREVMSVGLKEAVDIADSLPHLLVGGLDRNNVEYIEKMFTSLGATVEINKDCKSTNKNNVVKKILELENNVEKEERKPHCPHCHSTNIKSISGLNRGISIAVWGVFSKKINKSFECRDCGYTW